MTIMVEEEIRFVSKRRLAQITLIIGLVAAATTSTTPSDVCQERCWFFPFESPRNPQLNRTWTYGLGVSLPQHQQQQPETNHNCCVLQERDQLFSLQRMIKSSPSGSHSTVILFGPGNAAAGNDLQVVVELTTLRRESLSDADIYVTLDVVECRVGWEDLRRLALVFSASEIIMEGLPIGGPLHPHPAIFINASVAEAGDDFSKNTSGRRESSRVKYIMIGENILHVEQTYDDLKYNNVCITCQRKDVSSENAQMLLKITTQFLKNLFPSLDHLRIYNYNLQPHLPGGHLDLTALGAMSAFTLVNMGLTRFPRLMLREERLARVYNTSERTYKRELLSRPFLPNMLPSEFNRYKIDSGYLFPGKLFDMFSDRWEMRDVDLRYNLITAIPKLDYLRFVDTIRLDGNMISGGGLRNLGLMVSAFVISLTGNPLHHIPDEAFEGLSILEILYLDHCRLARIDNVNWAPLKSIIHLGMGANQIDDISAVIEETAATLAYLIVDRNNISSMRIPGVPTSLIRLKLSGNHFTRVPSAVFHPNFAALREILLLYNPITSGGVIPELLPHLLVVTAPPSGGERKRIELQSTCVKYVRASEKNSDAGALDRLLSGYDLLLFDNHLHCGCKEMKSSLARDLGVDVTTGLSGVQCEPELDVTTPFQKQLRDRIYSRPRCPATEDEAMPHPCEKFRSYVIGGTVSALGMLMISSVFCYLYRYRSKLFANCYLRTQWEFLREREEDGEDRQIDVVILYSMKHIRKAKQLLHLLEGGKVSYSVCFPDRDFMAGSDIHVTILNALSESKRCILLINSNEEGDELFHFMFNAALLEAKRRKQWMFIIPVILNKINPKMKNFTTKQNEYLRTVSSIELSAKHFWRKLSFALPSRNKHKNKVWQNREVNQKTVTQI